MEGTCLTEPDGDSVKDETKPDIPTVDQTSIISNSQSQSQPILFHPSSVSTPVSLLIESLVKNICSIYENDSKKASIMYKRICDRLYKMNLLSESYAMREFEGIRSQYQRAFLHLLASVKDTGDITVPLRPIWPNADVTSHYRREFEEIEFIAGGGFGQVFKVRHKLDDTEYAIKKIPIRSEGIQSVRNYLSEVKTFASMNHTNIVQYKGAWLEIENYNSCNNKAITNLHNSITQVSNQHQSKYIYHEDNSPLLETNKHYDSSSDFQIDFEHSFGQGDSTKSHVSHEERRKGHSLSDDECGDYICKINLQGIETLRKTSKAKVKWATLYIQMALCQTTLKQWLEKRNSFSNRDKALIPLHQILRTDIIKQILIQLVNGLAYIHSKGVVHHDIKPSNIFIQVENNEMLVQLGDFGLACPLQNVRHSLAFGTKLYAAPEQLAGKCNPKSDMYSLGIVLFELVENFKTDMERVEHITELRKGSIPTELFITHPEFTTIIRNLVVRNPEKRSDTTMLLHILKASKSEEVEHLKMLLAEKDEEILHLRELLKSYGAKSI